MIVYRTETGLVAIIREHLSRSDDARALAKTIFIQGADLILIQMPRRSLFVSITSPTFNLQKRSAQC